MMAQLPGLEDVVEEGRVADWNVGNRSEPSDHETETRRCVTQVAHKVIGKLFERSGEVVVLDELVVVVEGHDDVLGIARHVDDLHPKRYRPSWKRFGKAKERKRVSQNALCTCRAAWD